MADNNKKQQSQELIAAFVNEILDSKQAEHYAEAFSLLDSNRQSLSDQNRALLAKCYRFGFGVKPDRKIAIELYSIPAENGLWWARRDYVDLLLFENTPHSNETARIKILSWIHDDDWFESRLIKVLTQIYNISNSDPADLLAKAYKDKKLNKEVFISYLLRTNNYSAIYEYFPFSTDARSILSPDKIRLSLKGNKLTASLDLNCKVYKYALVCNGQIQDTTRTSERECGFVLKDSGQYYVRIYTDSGAVNTLPARYSKLPTEPTSFNLPFFHSRYPFADFVLTDLPSVPEIQGFSSEKIPCGDRNLIFYSSEKIQSGLSNYYFFSGITQNHGNLVFGNEEYNDDLSEENIGNFTCVQRYKENNLKIFSDFYGLGKIYYYQENNQLIISNRLQLLLLTLSANGVKLKLNESAVLNNLSMWTGLLSEQPVTDEQMVEGVHLLRLGQYMVLSDKLQIESNSLYSFYNKKSIVVNSREFKKLLETSVSELTENLDAIFRSPRFKKYYFDVTGGLDSRTSLAAYSNIQSDKETYVYTYGKEGEIKTANCLASKLDLHYSPEYTARCMMKPNQTSADFNYMDYFERCVAFDFSSFSPSKFSVPSKISDEIRISGGLGEQMRHYMRKTLGPAADLSSFQQIFKAHFQDVAQIFVSDSVQTQNLINHISRYIDTLPGNDIRSKLELYYMSIRARYHFDYSVSYNISFPEWTPLQSKSAWELFLRTDDKKKSNVVIAALLNKLCDKFKNVPFETQTDTVNMIVSNLTLGTPISELDTLTISEDYTVALNSARKIYSEIYSIPPNPLTSELEEQYNILIENLKNLISSKLVLQSLLNIQSRLEQAKNEKSPLYTSALRINFKKVILLWYICKLNLP